MGKLDKKVAIITGGGSGIGRATSILFAREGANIVVADRVSEEGTKTTDMIKATGGDALFAEVDVSKKEDVQKMVRSTIKTYGRLDILFNNAGIIGRGLPVTKITEKEWNACISTNLTSVWLGMKYAIPEMLEIGGGAIINNASISGIIAFPGGSAEYAAAKAGVIMLTKKVAVELAERHIRVNCICPGHCLTPMIEKGLGHSEEVIAELHQRQPIGRMGTPDEVSQAALFLACEESSSFITGAVLVVDGGYSIAARGKPLVVQEYEPSDEQ